MLIGVSKLLCDELIKSICLFSKDCITFWTQSGYNYFPHILSTFVQEKVCASSDI